MLQENPKDVYLPNFDAENAAASSFTDLDDFRTENVTQSIHNSNISHDDNRQKKNEEIIKDFLSIQPASQYTYGAPVEVEEKAGFTQKNYNSEVLYTTNSDGETVKNFETYTPEINRQENNIQNQFAFGDIDGGVLLLLFILRIIGANVCSTRAIKLNRNSVGWGIFGFVAPIIAMIWTNYLKPSTKWDKN
jgi:hypothetical protein